jgi:hypothetical protein
MQIPVGWTVGMAAGVAYNICRLKAVEEARKHGIDSCRPDARPIERRTYVLISTVQYHWSCN